MKCKICKRNYKGFKGLSCHIRQSHNITSQFYYDMFLKNKNEEICFYSGCNNKTKFNSLKNGYNKFCSCKCRSSTKKFKIMIKQIHCNKISTLKGKTYEEIHGKEKAYQLRNSRSKIRKGKILSNKTKNKIRNSRKLNKCGIGIKNGMYGKRHTEKVKKKQSIYMKNGGASHARSFLKRISKPQQQLYNIVCEILPYVILEYPCLNKSIDIAIPKLSIAIEYDCSYFHQDTKGDRKRQQLLEEEGWNFIRYRDYIPTKEELLSKIKNTLITRD